MVRFQKIISCICDLIKIHVINFINFSRKENLLYRINEYFIFIYFLACFNESEHENGRISSE